MPTKTATRGKSRKLKPPFIIVGMLDRPTCGRSDCDPGENPEHWTSVELTRQAEACLKLFPELAAFVRSMGDEEHCNCISEHSWYGEGHCSACPCSQSEGLIAAIDGALAQ